MAEFYFAYGSNLHRGQFATRCPDAMPVAPLTLPDFRLVFRRVADIEDAPGHHVQGAIYRITRRCEAALDRYEGFPHLYFKRTFPIEVTRRKRTRIIDVMFYTMHDDSIAPPPGYYLQTIKAKYDHWNIEHDTLIAAVEHARRAQAERRPDPCGDGRATSQPRRDRAALSRVAAHGSLLDEA